MKITKGKYTIFEFEDYPDLVKVKVINVYETERGRVVRYRFNWPFPITRDELEADFVKRIARK